MSRKLRPTCPTDAEVEKVKDLWRLLGEAEDRMWASRDAAAPIVQVLIDEATEAGMRAKRRFGLAARTDTECTCPAVRHELRRAIDRHVLNTWAAAWVWWAVNEDGASRLESVGIEA
jgi:hypothetical protein